MNVGAYRQLSTRGRARFLVEQLNDPTQISTADLARIAQHETVPQLQTLLNRIIEARRDPEVVESGPNGPEPLSQSGQVDLLRATRHEIAPLVGGLQMALMLELGDDRWETSESWAWAKRLQFAVLGTQALFAPGQALQSAPVDLDELISMIARIENCVLEKSDQLEVVQSDPNVLALLLDNVIRNARTAAGNRSVTIRAGMDSKKDWWISVSNPYEGEHLAWEGGASLSTKGDTGGAGLGIIGRAATALDLEVSLSGTNGIATFIVRGS